MTRADLLQLLAIATHAPRPTLMTSGGFAVRLPTPDEWAAHLLTHALALDRAIEAKLGADEHVADEIAHIAAIAAIAADADHMNECTSDQCAAGCPDVLRRRNLACVESDRERERQAATQDKYDGEHPGSRR